MLFISSKWLWVVDSIFCDADWMRQNLNFYVIFFMKDFQTLFLRRRLVLDFYILVSFICYHRLAMADINGITCSCSNDCWLLKAFHEKGFQLLLCPRVVSRLRVQRLLSTRPIFFPTKKKFLIKSRETKPFCYWQYVRSITLGSKLNCDVTVCIGIIIQVKIVITITHTINVQIQFTYLYLRKY